MTLEDIEYWLQAWIIESADVSDITLGPDSQLISCSLIDSMTTILLIEACENNFSICFANEDFTSPNFDTIKGISTIIYRKLTDAPG